MSGILARATIDRRVSAPDGPVEVMLQGDERMDECMNVGKCMLFLYLHQIIDLLVAFI